MALLDQKNKVLDTLTKEGHIDHLRAQLRAHVVRTLEEEKKKSLGSSAKYIKPLSLSTTRKVVGNDDGLLCAELIREFLTFYKMEHTLSVFIPEMSLHAGFPKSRDELGRECGLMRSQIDEKKPLLLNCVEKVRVGDYGPGSQMDNQNSASANKKSQLESDNMSESPGQMQPHFMDDHRMDQTPPATNLHGSGSENQNSRKNTMNHKQKGQSKQKKGTPVQDSDSSSKKQNAMSSLGDLPGFGSKYVAPIQDDYDNNFGFDDDDNSNENQDNNAGNDSRYSNAEKYLDDFDQEEKEGFKVEVKRPNKKKAQPVSSGNRKHSKFGGNKGKTFEIDDVEDDNEIEEDIQTDRDKDFGLLGDNIQSSLGHQAGITVSQSLGIDPSVDSLALDEYDHIEVVEI